MEPIIEIKNISKKYRITHQRGGYVALRDVLMTIIRKPVSFFKQKARSAAGLEKKEDFWALKDINVSIKPGEIIGIIGSNGAGKSTLLKILSQITPPTEGEIIMRGSVGSLLEVGTGFHPELTGRENIFLNGAILGMGRREIAKKFDKIVEFAGIDKFLDTPVKYYSSGMYVRLAFSVAAHMEPDILLVDEVLAVGDAEFQKKCLGKMEEVTKKNGRTIIFVSHNMAAIEQLCKRCIHIENGKIKEDSTNVKKVINNYLHQAKDNIGSNKVWVNSGQKFENNFFKPLKMFLSTTKKDDSNLYEKTDEVWLRIEAEVKELDPSLTVGYGIYNDMNELLYWSFDTDQDEQTWPRLSTGISTLETKLPINLLNDGIYRIELLVALHNRIWIIKPGENNPTVSIMIGGKQSNSPYWNSKRPGVLAPLVKWDLISNN